MHTDIIYRIKARFHTRQDAGRTRINRRLFSASKTRFRITVLLIKFETSFRFSIKGKAMCDDLRIGKRIKD
jgi:hypothetical protein